jgi:dTDP-4-amino-4,6-dideoxygalactose transaminase
MSLVSFPYSRQKIDNEDIKSVTRLLKKDIITQGQEGILFEKKLSSIVKSKYATSFNSATSALHAACHALSISKNDLVWTVTNSFVASANCALYCGAKIDFLDINNSTWNMDINKLNEKLLQAKKKNLLPKVIINVHIGGLPENQKKLWKLSKEYNFKIIEDASHSLGASYCKEQVGSCKWSDITVFSFHPVKIITTGEGGMATTNNKIIDDRLKVFRSHGITKNPSKFIYSETKKWQYEH